MSSMLCPALNLSSRRLYLADKILRIGSDGSSSTSACAWICSLAWVLQAPASILRPERLRV
jgi:hypothetical protein